MYQDEFIAGKRFVFNRDTYHFKRFDRPLYKENDKRNQNLILGDLIKETVVAGTFFCDASFAAFFIVYHPLFASVQIPYSECIIIKP